MEYGPQHRLYVEWLQHLRGPRDNQLEAELLGMADACDAAFESGELSAEQLQVLINGASSPRALLWSNAVELLLKCSGRWTVATDAIATMFRSRKAHVRFAALCSLGPEPPVEVTDALLSGGLRDKSSRVRWKAADRANALERRHLVPEITAALAAESDNKVRPSMELSLRMLRDGHWVEPHSPGWVTVTARRHNGISSRFVSDGELQTKGLERILEELRARL